MSPALSSSQLRNMRLTVTHKDNKLKGQKDFLPAGSQSAQRAGNTSVQMGIAPGDHSCLGTLPQTACHRHRAELPGSALLYHMALQLPPSLVSSCLWSRDRGALVLSYLSCSTCSQQTTILTPPCHLAFSSTAPTESALQQQAHKAFPNFLLNHFKKHIFKKCT